MSYSTCYTFVAIFYFSLFTAAFCSWELGRQEGGVGWGACSVILTFFVFYPFMVPSSSQWPASQSRGGACQLHVNKSDVALASAQQAARADPRVPGALCQDAKWGGHGAANYQGHPDRRCSGRFLSHGGLLSLFSSCVWLCFFSWFSSFVSCCL